jgi:hypothetical protein
VAGIGCILTGGAGLVALVGFDLAYIRFLLCPGAAVAIGIGLWINAEFSA